MKTLITNSKWRWFISLFALTVITFAGFFLSNASGKQRSVSPQIPVLRAPIYITGGFTFGNTQQLVPTLLTFGLEPEIKTDIFGNIYVTNIQGSGGGGVDLFKSTNKGTSFTFLGKPDGAVCPTGANCLDGAGIGGGDDSIDVSSGGYLYVSSLWAGSDSMSVTMDGGFTWIVSPGASDVPVIDRQWIAAYGPQTVYNGFSQIVGLDTPAIYVSKSTDAGKTYPQVAQVNDITQIRNDRQGNLVVDQYTGNIYFAFIPQQYDDGTPVDQPAEHHTPAEVWFARSTDGGLTWTLAQAYQGPPGSDTRHSFPITAIDRGDNLHLAFARCDVDAATQARSNCQIWMTSSSDQGATWFDAVRVSNGPDTTTAVFPWVVAGSSGIVDVTWIGTSASSPDVDSNWHLFFTQTRDALSAAPTFSQVQAVAQIVHNQSICFRGLDCDINGGNRDLAEYYSMTIDPDGNANIAFSDDVNNTFLGAGLASSWYTKQAGGLSAYATQSGPAPATFAANIPVGSPGGEPGMKVDSHNCMFVTTPGHPWVWKSENNGLSFLPPVNPVADRVLTHGDEDILPIPQLTGARPDLLYFADLGMLVVINIAESTDGGVNWFAPGPGGAAGEMDAVVDRQWIAYDRNVPAANDLTVYEMDHDAGAEAIRFNALTNDGTWSPPASGITAPEMILPPDSTFPNTNPGPVFVDPLTHAVYGVFTASTIRTNEADPPVPFGKLPNVWVAFGASPAAAGAPPGPFTNVPVFKGVQDSPSALPSPAPTPDPAARTYGTNAANDFPAAAIDAGGNIYVAWAMNNGRTNEYMVWMATSHDHGQSFYGPFQVSQGPGAAVMPWIAAGDAGRIDIVYYATTTPVDPNIAPNTVEWNTMFAQSFNADVREPAFTVSPVSHHVMHTGPICNMGILCGTGTRTLADFFQVAIGPDGVANIAYADNGPFPLPPGNLDSSQAGTHAEFARQASGPLALTSPSSVTCLPGPPPLSDLVSRKFHGSITPAFDIHLLPPNPAIEMRRNTGADTSGPNLGHDHELVFTFPVSVTVTGGCSATGGATCTLANTSGAIITADLHNVTDVQALTVTLVNVNGGGGAGNVPGLVNILAGDTNEDKRTNVNDINQTKSRSGQLTDSSNFRNDVTLDGRLNVNDINFVKSHSGNSLP